MASRGNTRGWTGAYFALACQPLRVWINNYRDDVLVGYDEQKKARV